MSMQTLPVARGIGWVWHHQYVYPITVEAHERAASIELQRYTSSRGLGARLDTSVQRDAVDQNEDGINGALGELALAELLRVDHEIRLDTFGSEPDVGSRYDMKTTTHTGGHLIIREWEKWEDRIFVLGVRVPYHVDADGPAILLVGYALGREFCGKERARLESNGVRWWIPQQELRDIGTLPMEGHDVVIPSFPGEKP